MNKVQKNIIDHGYFKSKHSIKDCDGGVFITTDILNYYDDEYEKLTDSKGKSHLVLVERTGKQTTLKDDDFTSNGEHITHKRFTLVQFTFQYNLNYYHIITKSWISAYQECYNLLHYNFKYSFSNWHNYHFNGYDYVPIYETVFVSGNNHYIENYIPDSVFFKFKDRKQAVSRINNKSAKPFEKAGYENLDDIELIDFMQKRLIAKGKYINKYKQLYGNTEY